MSVKLSRNRMCICASSSVFLVYTRRKLFVKIVCKISCPNLLQARAGLRVIWIKDVTTKIFVQEMMSYFCFERGLCSRALGAFLIILIFSLNLFVISLDQITSKEHNKGTPCSLSICFSVQKFVIQRATW